MTAWHGNAALKSEVEARMVAHRAEDEIVQGFYQDENSEGPGYRGCLIGCTLPKLDHPTINWHRRVQAEYGIPEQVGHLLDRIFEDLSPESCAAFAVESIKVIPVGADLSMVVSRMMWDILLDQEHGVSLKTEESSAERALVETVGALYARRLHGEDPDQSEWRDAARAAYAARTNAARAYTASLACNASLAYNAARAAVFSADHAACATAYFATCAAEVTDAANAVYSASAAGDARGAGICADSGPEHYYGWIAGRLIHHLATAPVPADNQLEP